MYLVCASLNQGEFNTFTEVFLRETNAADFSNNYFRQHSFLSLAPGFALHESGQWVPGLLNESWFWCAWGKHFPVPAQLCWCHGQTLPAGMVSAPLASLFSIREPAAGGFWQLVWFAACASGRDSCHLSPAGISSTSGEEQALPAPTDGCDAVPVGLTLAQILVPGTSGRDLVAAAAVASSWFRWGPPQLKRLSINTMKRIWRSQVWQPWLLRLCMFEIISVRLFGANHNLILSYLRICSVVQWLEPAWGTRTLHN